MLRSLNLCPSARWRRWAMALSDPLRRQFRDNSIHPYQISIENESKQVKMTRNLWIKRQRGGEGGEKGESGRQGKRWENEEAIVPTLWWPSRPWPCLTSETWTSSPSPLPPCLLLLLLLLLLRTRRKNQLKLSNHLINQTRHSQWQLWPSFNRPPRNNCYYATPVGRRWGGVRGWGFIWWRPSRRSDESTWFNSTGSRTTGSGAPMISTMCRLWDRSIRMAAVRCLSSANWTENSSPISSDIGHMGQIATTNTTHATKSASNAQNLRRISSAPSGIRPVRNPPLQSRKAGSQQLSINGHPIHIIMVAISTIPPNQSEPTQSQRCQRCQRCRSFGGDHLKMIMIHFDWNYFFFS